MGKIITLTDYKGQFGSKSGAVPYRGGFDLDFFGRCFNDLGYDFESIGLSEINFRKGIDPQAFYLYTSSEDVGYLYKSFIEDVVSGLEAAGATVLPAAKFLRATNNKVYMEMLRDIILPDSNPRAQYFGALEEVDASRLRFPVVVKTAGGALSTGVFLAHDERELCRIVKKVSRSGFLVENIKDRLRALKHNGYVMESLSRKKFILQEFSPGLTSDFKVLCFGDKFYVVQRKVRPNDFRASGGGLNSFGSSAAYVAGLFDYAQKVYSALNVPNVSLDIACKGEDFFLFEFQAVYFGGKGQRLADGYYQQKDGQWVFVSEQITYEKLFADSIHWYLSRNKGEALPEPSA